MRFTCFGLCQRCSLLDAKLLIYSEIEVMRAKKLLTVYNTPLIDSEKVSWNVNFSAPM